MATATDDFNRADNPTDLGSNWAHIPSIAANSMTINTNRARVATQSGSAWNTSFGADQYCQYTLSGIDAAGGHLWLFINLGSPAMGSFTGYLLDMIQGGSGLCDMALYRGNAGSYTTIVSTVTGITYADGDLWYLGKQGSALTVKRNGTPVSSFNAVTDGSPLTGAGYVGIGGNSTSLAAVTDFEGGDISIAPVNITPESLYSAG